MDISQLCRCLRNENELKRNFFVRRFGTVPRSPDDNSKPNSIRRQSMSTHKTIRWWYFFLFFFFDREAEECRRDFYVNFAVCVNLYSGSEIINDRSGEKCRCFDRSDNNLFYFLFALMMMWRQFLFKIIAYRVSNGFCRCFADDIFMCFCVRWGTRVSWGIRN